MELRLTDSDLANCLLKVDNIQTPSDTSLKTPTPAEKDYNLGKAYTLLTAHKQETHKSDKGETNVVCHTSTYE